MFHEIATKDVRAEVRWMISSNLDEVLAIEEECFLNEWAVPWTRQDFVDQMDCQNVIGMVAIGLDGQLRERVLAYVVYALHRRSIELINLAVATAVQRCGIGSELVDRLISKLGVNERRRIVATVCERNLDGQRFFRAKQFRAVRLMRDYYASGVPDCAIKFVYHQR
jgi:ribosomal protein S18 acetylase RimI-like enzyme